ncbi:hypothetical protein BU25DRAFT_406368 [Macroventuria anomochaeta]|uniref:Uncharacterized protein n=1 Tax=Macroventuria anomochaeta TaxID=301207 RepID=A0ACB6SIH8_9PLEO|nr:uncharacterized protein BU25DRAFT_406368 [Macroventuria anomochaeta]KAF2633114.1 hypothetical protein BU25DRAFT_406368 [Macroventuria anomochaeta]
MPRPTDTYTHSQFEQIDSVNLGGTVQCIHCRRWQGSARVLNRKKAHLQICPEYTAWRAAGNGQELAPPNSYNATGRRAIGDSYDVDNSSPPPRTSSTPTMQRPRWTVNVSKYFDEFFDDSLGHKCARVRCHSCGFVRAKNATRQAEHLIQCKEFLSTAEGAELLTSGTLAPNEQQNEKPPAWNGAKPNPDLLINRHGPNRSSNGMTPSDPGPRPFLPQTAQSAEAPSLAQYLLVHNEALLTSATHHTFLSHAGCGMLTENALNEWLAQIGFISRSLVSFTGALIGKIRIPETANLERDSTFRCLDLLCSAVSNMKKELDFLDATKRKYGLGVNFDEPKPPTKGFVDLFNSASSPSATLLEGMVVLWAIEILFYNSCSYAATFITRTTPTPQQNSYFFPSYFLPSGAPATSYGGQATPRDGHTTALREAVIENWKSENFGRFVDACRSIVDELAMVQTTGNGRAEMSACERVFKQAIWLWGQIFPEVIGMEQLDDLNNGQNHRDNGDNGAINRNGSADKPVEVDDEDEAHTSTDSS